MRCLKYGSLKDNTCGFETLLESKTSFGKVCFIMKNSILEIRTFYKLR